MNKRQTGIVVFLFLLLLWLAWGIYQPARSGTLVFDDIPNLQPWQEIGDINSFQALTQFAFSSSHIPGRPLSLISFAIDDQSWPANTDALKRTNILLHLLNAALAFALLRILALRLASPCNANFIALIAATIWTLHPLQASNVAYIIQRMNLLSSLFTLSALIIYCIGRSRLDKQQWSGLVVCSIAAGLFIPLGILAKENALVTCVYILLIEAFYYHSPTLSNTATNKNRVTLTRLWNTWKILALWLPCVIFAAYATRVVLNQPDGFETRNFTAGERFLTQGPVLANYLGKLVAPRIHDSGLYFDNFPISHGIDLTTLISWSLIIFLLLIAYRLKRKKPFISFGIFFYFSGHLMESTVLPLELYFEHRNYLPQLGIWLAISWIIVNYAHSRRRTVIASIVLIISTTLLCLLTWQHATTWGDNRKQTTHWYAENPLSLRTSMAYARLQLSEGHVKTAKETLFKAQRAHPDSLTPLLTWRYWNCLRSGEEIMLADLPEKAKTADYDVTIVSIIMEINQLARSKNNTNCHYSKLDDLEKLMHALLTNRHYSAPDTYSAINMSLAEIAAAKGDLDATISYYDESTKATPNPVYPYKQAYYLLSAGITDPAISYLNKASHLMTWRYRIAYPDLSKKIEDMRIEIQKTVENTSMSHNNSK